MFGMDVHEHHELGAPQHLPSPVFYRDFKILIVGQRVELSFNPKFPGYFFLTVESLL